VNGRPDTLVGLAGQKRVSINEGVPRIRPKGLSVHGLLPARISSVPSGLRVSVAPSMKPLYVTRILKMEVDIEMKFIWH